MRERNKTRQLKRKESTCSMKMRVANQSLIALIVVVVIVTSCIQIQIVDSSPPVDYLLYTSQSAQQAGFSSIDSHLPPLNSIYSSDTPASSSSKGAENENEMIKRVLSLVRNSSHSHDNNLIDIETARYAWHLMEKQALLYAKNRVDSALPLIKDLLMESQVSQDCSVAIFDWMNEMKRLERWASLMWNSWGEFPASGFFEGSFTDLGSYRSCMSIEDNSMIGQAQYCTLDFQPLIPTRPRFHSILKQILDVDPKTGRIFGGDFNEEKISSQHSAHEYSSSRYLRMFNELAESRNLLQQQQQANVLTINRYNKRTILQNGTEDLVFANQSLDSPNLNMNLTLKTTTLVELLRKAQYFYYVKLRIGACFPSKCSQDDVQKLAQTAGQRAILQANPVNCLKKEPFTLNIYQKVAIWILSVLALIAILGTIVDLLGSKVNQNSNSFVRWLLPFSLWTNTKRLFDISENSSTHTDLECIHGLRFFSMVWVVYGHTILYTEYQTFTHFFDMIERQIPNFLLLPTLNANFSVDTFFVISGILTTYVTWEYTKGDPRKFNKFAFAVSRYIRLTPQLFIVILCFFLLPLFGDGPMYKQVTEDKAEVCYNNWAINLLYLQSYINTGKLCIDPSWWLSIEMTFHLVSMIVIVVMIKNPRKGMIVNFAIAAFLTAWGAFIHYSNRLAIQYLPSIPQRYEVVSDQTKLFFHRPYPHAAAYFIGIALGYVLANKTVKKLTRSQIYQGWTGCAIGLIVSLWSSYYWNLGASYTQLQATLYYHLCQILWPLSISWIILACSIGHGGFVERVLSAKCFVPLGRITYMTYLSHALIIYYHSASTNIPQEPSLTLFLYMFLATTFLSLCLGIVLTVVYESPILNLQKQLLTYLTEKFDPTARDQLREQLPNTTGCEKIGASAATVLLLSNNKSDVANGVSIST